MKKHSQCKQYVINCHKVLHEGNKCSWGYQNGNITMIHNGCKDGGGISVSLRGMVKI